MKVPLRFQITEFDCGTVALNNALSYLYERKEIPAAMIKAIHRYTLDCYDKYGNLGQGGTSRRAIKNLTNWLTRYARKKNIDLDCVRLTGEEVTLERMKECINSKGVIFIRCWQKCEHYVIITDIDDEYFYIFDSYYFDETYYDEDGDVEIIFDQIFKYNRKVKLKRIFSETKKDFSIGTVEFRDCVLMQRK